MSSNKSEYFFLDPKYTDPKRIKKERQKAHKLKKTQWWLNHIKEGFCYYCKKKFLPSELTLDHIVPLARGGTSTKNNIVPACKKCNQEKKLKTPVDQILK